MKKLFFFGFGWILLLFLMPEVLAQKVKFGHINPSDLRRTTCALDTSADAAVLYFERITYFKEMNNKLFLFDDYLVRKKIFTEEGFDEATNKIELAVLSGTDREVILNLKGYTYNWRNGKVVRTPLDKKKIYRENTYRHKKVKSTIVKYTMPDVHPGSIVEWRYTIRSPFFMFPDPYRIQREIPVRKVLVKINIPQYLHYQVHFRGYYPLKVKKWQENHYIELVQENIPPLHDEPYAGNIENYMASFELELTDVNVRDMVEELTGGQLNDIQYSGSDFLSFSGSWGSVVSHIYSMGSFGMQLDKKLHLKDDAKAFAHLNEAEKIQSVYEWIKKKIKWNGHKSYITENGVVKAYFKGEGNVADINLNLVNMLRLVGMDAYPVLVSTVSNGIPLYPSLVAFDYVVAAVKTNNGTILLDATEKYAIPGMLPERALNFYGRIIYDSEKSEFIDLFPSDFSSLVRNVMVKWDPEMEAEGFYIIKRDKYWALRMRKHLDGKRLDELEKWFGEHYKNLDIEQGKFVNLDDPYALLLEKAKFETDNFIEEIGGKIYISPLMEWRRETNPFKAEKRQFPIFYNFPRLVSNQFTFRIPEGYRVVSVPQDSVIAAEKNIATYKYTAKVNGNQIVITTLSAITRAAIPADYYSSLKSFYDQMIWLENRKIVLEKK